MTKQEMLALVEAQIRKDIPRLMELTEGCRFVIKDEIYGEIVFIDFNYSVYFLLNNTLQTCDLKTLKDESVVKIIGHDIMINDILEWFAFLNSEGEEPFCYFTIDVNGNLLFDKFEESTMALYWDLSSPYLKDQSEELIKFLYNIAKDE